MDLAFECNASSLYILPSVWQLYAVESSEMFKDDPTNPREC